LQFFFFASLLVLTRRHTRRQLSDALDTITTYAIIYTFAVTSGSATHPSDAPLLRKLLVSAPRLDEPSSSRGDSIRKLFAHIEPAVSRSLLDTVVANRINPLSPYFESMRLLLARPFLETNRFPAPLDFLIKINHPHFRLLARVRAVHWRAHSFHYLDIFQRLIAPMVPIDSWPFPAVVPIAPPAPIEDGAKAFSEPIASRLGLDIKESARLVLEALRAPVGTAASADASDPIFVDRLRETTIASAAAAIFALDARNQGPPPIMVEAFKAYVSRRAQLSPAFASDFIFHSVRHLVLPRTAPAPKEAQEDPAPN
jgi:hypothetical protein